MKDSRIHLAVLLALAAGNGIGLPEAQAAVVITETFTPGADVPDGGTVTDTQTFQVEMGNLLFVSVNLYISGQTTGAYNGNLYSTLTHGGLTSVLLNQPGATTANPTGYSDPAGISVTLTDGVSDDIHTYQDVTGVPDPSLPVQGYWQPDGRQNVDIDPGVGLDVSTPRNAMLSQFYGQPSSGDWSLSVQDVVSTGAGSHRLESWGVMMIGDTGTGTTVLTDGSSVETTGGEETFSNQVTFLGHTTFDGVDPINMNGGVVLAAPTTLRVESLLTINSNITESGGSQSLTKEGYGTLVINGTASHTGDTLVNTGELRVNGTVTTSQITVGYSGMLSGTGTVAKVLLDGGAIYPGAGVGKLSSGTQTWNAGSAFLLDVNDATGTAGVNSSGWGFLEISGKLKLIGDVSNPFLISLASVEPCGCTGLASNFDPSNSYAWKIVSTTCGIEGFNPGMFTVDTTYFSNDTAGGQFFVSQSGNDLYLNFAPVPEPAAVGTIAVILLAGAAIRSRRRAVDV